MSKFDILLKKTWYIQGINAVPVYVVAGPISGIFACKKTLGYNFSHFLLSFKKDYSEFCYCREDLHYMYDEFSRRYKKDKKYLDWLLKTSEKEKKPVLDYVNKKLDRIYELSDEQLIEEYKKFAEMFYYCYGASHLVEPIALTTDVVIKDLLLKDLEKLNLEEKFTHYFTELTQPTMKFFFSDFNQSLRSMINMIKQDKNLVKLFKESLAMVERNMPSKLKKAIDVHLKSFFWIKSQWNMGVEYSVRDVLEELKEILKSKEEIEVTTDAKLKENLRKKKLLYKELNLSKELQDLIEITDFTTYWQDDRKVIILIGVWAFEKFVNEIAKRFKANPDDLKYMMIDEISAGSIPKMKRILAERRKASFYLFYKKDRAILTGKDYEEFRKRLDAQKQDDDMKEINGMCASIGTAVGRVKVCLTVDVIEKVKKGDILVTTMTRPEFVPAMKKATAIVTDEGGITCHAAVISRELGIPCVIGTKRATKLLKDNDLVEVNANHGIVKVMKGGQ